MARASWAGNSWPTRARRNGAPTLPCPFSSLTSPEAGEYFIQRGKGAIEAAKKILPQLEVTEISTKGNPEVTRQMTADYLTSHPKGKILMWCHIDQIRWGCFRRSRLPTGSMIA